MLTPFHSDPRAPGLGPAIDTVDRPLRETCSRSNYTNSCSVPPDLVASLMK